MTLQQKVDLDVFYALCLADSQWAVMAKISFCGRVVKLFFIMKKVHLRDVDHSWYNKGAGIAKRTLWYYTDLLLVRPSVIPFMAFKVLILRVFGAKIGKRICLKPNVHIKSPWNLTIGCDCWIGEGVWIDNLDKVTIGNNVCISQGAMLLTGNHDYTDGTMPYRNAPIIVEDGSWIGAKTVVCPGVTVHEGAILTVGSIATKNMEAWMVYQGNPATKIRERKLKK